MWLTWEEWERAILKPQSGRMSSIPLVSRPTSRLNQFDAQPFRWLLLLCRPLVAFTTGQLARQQVFLAVRADAAARICREAGARAPSKVTFRDLDHVPSRHRRDSCVDTQERRSCERRRTKLRWRDTRRSTKTQGAHLPSTPWCEKQGSPVRLG